MPLPTLVLYGFVASALWWWGSRRTWWKTHSDYSRFLIWPWMERGRLSWLRCPLDQEPPVLKLETLQADMAMLLHLAGMGKPQACLGDSPTELLLWKNRLQAGHCLGAKGHGQPRDMPYLSGIACFLLRSSKSGHPKGTWLIPGRAITWPKRVPGTCVFRKNENRNQTTTTTVPHNCT